MENHTTAAGRAEKNAKSLGIEESDLVEGAAFMPRGGRPRRIVTRQGDTIEYAIDGVPSLAPLQAQVQAFVAWIMEADAKLL